MSVIEERIRLTLEERISQSLKNAEDKVTKFNSSVQGLSAGMKNLHQSSESAFRTLTKFSGLYKAIGTIGNALGGSIGQVLDYSKSFQTNAVGMSGILASMTTLGGKTLEWNKAMEISNDIMTKLRVQALQTAATSTDLVETFRALLGPGLSSGMSIDEIMKFSTVGVNAVKSIGLPTNQYIQELRGLVQGGIRASSSTLATALGLKDADIEAAKNSSEGLFKFLMNRLEGFVQATGATSQTLQGQIEIAKEGILSSLSQASDNILNTYSETLNKINGILLTKNEDTGLFEINPEVVSKLSEYASVIDKLLSKLIDFGANLSGSFGILARNLLVIVGVPKIIELITSNVENLVGKFETVRNLIVEHKNTEEEYAQVVRQVLRDEEQRIAVNNRLLGQSQQIEAIIKEMIKANKGDYSSMVAKLRSKLENLKLGESEINERIISQLTRINAGKHEEVAAINAVIVASEKERETFLSNEKVKKSFTDKVGNAIGVASEFTGALSAVGTAIIAVTDSNDSWLNTLGEGLTTIDTCISAVGNMSTAIQGLTKWWKALDLATKSCITTMGVAGVVLGVAALAAYKAYEDYSIYQENGLSAFEIDGDDVVVDYDKINKAKARKQFLEDAEKLEKMKREEEARYAAEKKAEELKLKFQRPAAVKGAGGGTTKQDKTAQNIASYKELMTAVRNSTEALNTNQSAYDKTMNSAEKQLDTWNKTLVKLSESGALSEEELKKAKELMSVYYSEMTKKAEAEQQKQNLSLIKLHTEQAKLTMELGRGNQQEEYNRVNESLQTHKEYLEKMLENQKLSAEERINIEKEYAATGKAIRENDMLDYKKSWKAVLEELSQRQINYGDSIKSVFSSIESAGVTLLTSTKSFGEGIKTFFQDVASSILSEMAKIIMKGLVTNAILSFGIGGSGKRIGTGRSTGSIGSYNTSNILKKYVFQAANGGVQQGWGIVGERGPELVNFSNPGRVYTADQTRNALSGGGQVNIKIDLKNESGQQMQAETTGTQFDGESYVVGVVLKAISTNKNGMRNVIRGVAAT